MLGGRTRGRYPLGKTAGGNMPFAQADRRAYTLCKEGGRQPFRKVKQIFSLGVTNRHFLKERRRTQMSVIQ